MLSLEGGSNGLGLFKKNLVFFLLGFTTSFSTSIIMLRILAGPCLPHVSISPLYVNISDNIIYYYFSIIIESTTCQKKSLSCDISLNSYSKPGK